MSTSPNTSLYSFACKYGPWAVVTGASSGIGAEFARQLAVLGLHIVLIARREARLQALAQELRQGRGVEVKVLVVDLSTTDGVGKVIAECERLQVGLLVNNAGIEVHGSFFHDPFEQHRQCLQLNVVAVSELAYTFGRRFCEQGRGGIVFLSSLSAAGIPWMATYSSSKAFVTTLAVTLWEEVRRKGVDVLALEPGFVASEMTLDPGQVEHKYGATLMRTETCVKEALEVLGKKLVYTPGWWYRAAKHLYYLLPRYWGLRLLADSLRKVMDPRLFEYCQEKSRVES